MFIEPSTHFILDTCHNIFGFLDILSRKIAHFWRFFGINHQKYRKVYFWDPINLGESDREFYEDHKYIQLESLNSSWEARELWASRGQIMYMVFWTLSYEEYNWEEIINDGQLKSMIVASLDKYLNHNSLKHLRGKNKQKVEGIRLHYMRNQVQLNATSSISFMSNSNEVPANVAAEVREVEDVGEEYDYSSDD